MLFALVLQMKYYKFIILILFLLIILIISYLLSSYNYVSPLSINSIASSNPSSYGQIKKSRRYFKSSKQIINHNQTKSPCSDNSSLDRLLIDNISLEGNNNIEITWPTDKSFHDNNCTNDDKNDNEIISEVISNPKLINTITLTHDVAGHNWSNWAHDLYIDNNILFIANRYHLLSVYDIENINNIKILKNIKNENSFADTYYDANSITCKYPFLYIADWTHGVYCIDISNIKNINANLIIEDKSTYLELLDDGFIMFKRPYSILQLYSGDINSEYNLEGSYNYNKFINNATTLSASNNKMVLVSGLYIYFYDISQKNSITLQATYKNYKSSYSSYCQVDNTGYVLSDYGLNILDVENYNNVTSKYNININNKLGEPIKITSNNYNWILHRMRFGNYLFQSYSGIGVVIYDISDPQRPFLKSIIPIKNERVEGVCYYKGHIFILTASRCYIYRAMSK